MNGTICCIFSIHSHEQLCKWPLVAAHASNASSIFSWSLSTNSKLLVLLKQVYKMHQERKLMNKKIDDYLQILIIYTPVQNCSAEKKGNKRSMILTEVTLGLQAILFSDLLPSPDIESWIFNFHEQVLEMNHGSMPTANPYKCGAKQLR